MKQKVCERNHNIRCAKARRPEINTKTVCENIHDSFPSSDCEILHNSQSNEYRDFHHNQKPLALVRLNRAIAATGLCSRRKADALILAGKVCINGNQVNNPAIQVGPGDQLSVDGKTLNQPPALTYAILNKPVHTVCTMHDPDGRQTVIDLLPEELKEKRLYPVGRLDYFSEGLLLLTNDGDVAQRLAHPKHQHTKVYEVLVRGDVPNSMLQTMRNGMILDGTIKLLPVKVTAFPQPNGNTLLSLELRQGINRQIRRMCDALKLTILRLVRVTHGNLKLAGLPSGKWRLLSSTEIDKLRKELGLMD